MTGVRNKNGENPRSDDQKRRLVQITDCHLGPAADFRLLGMRTLLTLRGVLNHIEAGCPPDCLLVTGDIAAEGRLEAYHRFAGEMARLGRPYHWLPGNHDDFDAMTNVPDLPPYRGCIDIARWRLLALKTPVAGEVGGHLDDGQLAFLSDKLTDAGGRHVALFLHHPPADVGCRWLDRQQVDNADSLAALLSDFGNVRFIAAGHVHQAGQYRFGNIPLYTTPSTCFQFAAGSDSFAIGSEPPGYRWFDLYDDGGFATDVCWLPACDERVDPSSSGY